VAPAALVVLALTAGVGPAAKAAPNAGERIAVAPCVSLAVSSTPATTNRAAVARFSARSITSLNFDVLLASGATPEGLGLKLFTPNGHLYQQIDVPVAPEGSLETERTLPGYELPTRVAVARSQPSSEGVASAVSLPPVPVPGTSITSNSLYGTWRAEAWTTGSSATCTTTFNVKQ
jgi:hypothetical protein